MVHIDGAINSITPTIKEITVNISQHIPVARAAGGGGGGQRGGGGGLMPKTVAVGPRMACMPPFPAATSIAASVFSVFRRGGAGSPWISYLYLNLGYSMSTQ
jgi:hypothetical protein